MSKQPAARALMDLPMDAGSDDIFFSLTYAITRR